MLACTLAVSLLLPSLALAQATTGFVKGDVLVWGAVGIEGDLGGSVNSSGVGTINGMRTEVNANAWGERYTPALAIQYGVAFNSNSISQFFVSGHWDQSESDTAVIGLMGGQPLTATFSDYQGWGFSFGGRRYFPTTIQAKPFVSGSIGFEHRKAINAILSSDPVGFIEQDVPFYADSWVTQWRVGGGMMWELTPRVGWQATADIKYSGVLSDVAGLGTLGLERINDTGNRWSLPVMAGIFVKF
jgi:hypothetical protein